MITLRQPEHKVYLTSPYLTTAVPTVPTVLLTVVQFKLSDPGGLGFSGVNGGRPGSGLAPALASIMIVSMAKISVRPKLETEP
jgi:hypothetical protein